MIAIAIKEETGIERCDEAVRCGVPFARGEAGEMDVWELLDESGHPVVSAVRAAAYWDDGSIKWLLVDFAATAAAGAEVVFRLRRIGESESAAAEDKPAPERAGRASGEAGSLHRGDGRDLPQGWTY